MANLTNKQYYYAIGRRKASSVTVRLYEGEGQSTINNKNIDDIYSSLTDQAELYQPLVLTGYSKKNMYFTVMAKGGGVKGQLDAIRLGVSRALLKLSPEFRSVLKAEGLLTRDSRIVERKKAGLKKARKAPQFSKR